MTESTEQLLERLRDTDDTVPHHLRREILDRGGEELVSGLAELVDEEALLDEDREAFSPPVHAATLLGLMGASSATDVLVDRVCRDGSETALGTAAGRALQNMGVEEGLQAVLDAMAERDAPRERLRLARVLGGFDGNDRRVVEALGREIDPQPPEGKEEILLAMDRYGAESAVEHVRSWVDSSSLSPEDLDERFLIELSAKVVQRLGGELTEEHRELLERARGVGGN